MEKIISFILVLFLFSCNQQKKETVSELLKKTELKGWELDTIINELKNTPVTDSSLLFDFRLGMTHEQANENLKKLIKEKRVSSVKFHDDLMMDSANVSFPLKLNSDEGQGSSLKLEFDNRKVDELSFSFIINNPYLKSKIIEKDLPNAGSIILRFQNEFIQLFTEKFKKSPFKLFDSENNVLYVWLVDGKEFEIHPKNIKDIFDSIIYIYRDEISLASVNYFKLIPKQERRDKLVERILKMMKEEETKNKENLLKNNKF